MKTAQKTLWMLTLIAALLTGMVFQARAEEGTPDKSVTLVMKNGAKASDYDRTESFGVMTALAVAGKLKAGEAPEGFEALEFYYDETGEAILFMYDSTSDSFGFGPAALDPEGGTKVIRAEITEEVRDGLRNFLTEMGDKLNAEQKQAVQDVIDGWKEAAISFAPLRHIQAETSGDGGLTVQWNGTNMTDEDFPDWYYSSYVGSYRLQAVPGEGSRFVKWVCNGTDYSTEPVITVELKDEHIELQAVFAMLPYYEASVTLWNGARREYLPSAELQGILLVLNAAGKLQEGKAPAQMPDAKGAFFYNEESQFLFGYFEEYERFIYGPEAIDVEGIARVMAAEITEDIRERLGYYLEAAKETEEAEYLDTIRDVIDNWTRAELVFAPPHRLTVEVQSGCGGFAYAEAGEALEEDYPMTQYETTFVGSYQLKALSEDGWQFVKWIKNGEDFSEEPEITVDLDEENVDLGLVFALIPNYEAVITFRNGIKSEEFYADDVLGVLTTLGVVGKVRSGDTPKGYEDAPETVQFYFDENDELLFLYDEESDRFGYGPAALREDGKPVVIREEITDEVREKLQAFLELMEDFDEDYRTAIQGVIESWTAAELRLEPLRHLLINVQGDGEFALAWDEELLSYDEEDLLQNYYTSYTGQYKLGALAKEGSRFVKWMKDGKDYTTKPEITITLEEEHVELEAVFEWLPAGSISLPLRNGARYDDYEEFVSVGVITTLQIAGKIQLAESQAGSQTVQCYNDEAGNLLFVYNDVSKTFAYARPDLPDITLEITDEIRDRLRAYLEAGKELFNESYKAILQEIIDDIKTVSLSFAPLHYINVSTKGGGRFAYAYDKASLVYGENLYQSYSSSSVGSYRFGAMAQEGYRFVKWTRDGKDFSTEAVITLNLEEEDINLVAVFELIPVPETAPPTEAAPETAAPTEAPAAPAEPASPPMGDESSLLLWMGLLLISALLSTALVVRKK